MLINNLQDNRVLNIYKKSQAPNTSTSLCRRYNPKYSSLPLPTDTIRSVYQEVDIFLCRGR